MVSSIMWSALLFLLNCMVARSFERWCPPSHFPFIRQTRQSNIRSAVISHIFGALSGPSASGEGYVPESWPTDDQLSRQLYYHLGLLGMDHYHFTVFFNSTLPPRIEEVYPNDSSCIRQWNNLGVLTWETVQYSGYSNHLHAEQFSATYGHIRAEYDWIAIFDIDELLVPTVWNPGSASWCSHERPTIIELAFQHMLTAATTKYLQSFDLMEKYRHYHLSAADACTMGSAIEHNYDTNQRVCTKIGYITLPGYYWETEDVNSLPTRRCRYAGAYGYTNDTVMKGEEDHQGQTWKSIHNTAVTTELSGDLTMHLGVGFSILAPRSYHKSGVSLELAHLRVPTGRDNYMMGDNKIVKLVDMYESCMGTLGSSQNVVPSENGENKTAFLSNGRNVKRLQSLRKQLHHLRKKLDELQ